jgi:hypothetical protein
MKPAIFLLTTLLAACRPVTDVSIRMPITREGPPAEATSKSYSLPTGTLTVIEVPVMELGRRATAFQTCYLYRDSTIASTALQCPSDRTSYVLNPPLR